MSLDGPIHVDYLTVEIIEKITEYINRVPSATVVVQNDNKPPRGQVITSELIYSHMVAYRIPFEAERWNIHRLLKLIGVVSAQNEEPKKMTRKEVIQQNRELNEQRRKQFNTKG